MGYEFDKGGKFRTPFDNTFSGIKKPENSGLKLSEKHENRSKPAVFIVLTIKLYFGFTL